MIPMTLAEIAAATGGTVHDADPATLVTGPARYDSRLIEAGGLFVAFAGENVDGHDFAARAVTAGAAAVLAGRPVGVPAVVVDDVQAALGRLAAALVDRAPHLTVVGVTGSVGKTTTKDLLGRTLARLGPTVAPPGNLNNEIGLPATVTLITPETRYLVCEMGARHVGDVAYLARLVRPSVGVVTTIGVSHLSEFGTLEHTTAAKAELIEALPPDGHAVVNADDPRVAGMARKSAAPVRFFGTNVTADVRAEDIRTDPSGRTSFRLCTPAGSARVTLRLIGAHYVANALAAAAATLSFTDDVAQIADALSSADRASTGRMHVRGTGFGITVIDDAYNASPASTAAALSTAATLAGGRRLVAVLGQMNELGPDSARHHRDLGAAAAAAGVRYLIGVGDAEAARIVASAAADGVEAEHVPDAARALELIRRRWAADDVVLVKGSHTVGLQALAQQLVKDGGPHRAATTAPAVAPILMSDPRVAAVPVRDLGEPLVRLDAGFGPARALVRAGLAARLDAARSALPAGLTLRVVEGHRPIAAQRAIIAAYEREVRAAHPGVGGAELRALISRFVAPVEVAPHVAGAAVDLTLAGADGAELDLGTAIDATPEASAGACYFAAAGISAAARRNRDLLARVLGGAGLVNYPTEWWHWSHGDRYWALTTGARHALHGPVPPYSSSPLGATVTPSPIGRPSPTVRG